MAKDKEHPALGRPSWLMQPGFIEYEAARRMVSKRLARSEFRRWLALTWLIEKLDAEFAKGVCYFYGHEIHQWYTECAAKAEWHPDD